VVQNLKPYTNTTLLEPQAVEKTSADGVVKARDGDDAGDRARTDCFPRSNQNARDKFNSAAYGAAKSRALAKTDVLIG
jgi:hypothetical protein